MKKIYLILSVFAIVFTACETDFDVNATWEEVIVVYGLLDAGDGKEVQQIKISKAFLGEMNALQMAQYADSINIDTSDFKVQVVRVKNNGDTYTMDCDPKETVRESGTFNEIIILYEFPKVDSAFNDFLQPNAEYELIVENKVSGNVVTSKTKIISNFDFDNVNSSGDDFFLYIKPLAPDSGFYYFKRLIWDHFTNGKIYQVDISFDYLENGESKNLIWSQPLVTSNGNTMNTLLEGEKFFTFLKNNITKDDTKHRNFVNIDLIMTVGTSALETYINVNRPITGIVQQRPQFTNINNGIGIFSSRFTHVRNNVDLSPDTKNYLIDELDRNFE